MKAIRASLFIGVAAVLAGCANGFVTTQTFTISGGQTVSLPVARGGAIPTENTDVRIEVTGLMTDADAKEVVYGFAFTEKNHAAPRSVKVEDVTGPTAELLVEDSSPQLSDTGFWMGKAKPRKKGDPGLAWLDEPGDTTKVFRFTIVTADGRELVMYQASIWSGAAKPMVRQSLS